MSSVQYFLIEYILAFNRIELLLYKTLQNLTFAQLDKICCFQYY